ncbi:hypothetical protein G7046_g889 [Stylonectria norvegica]|nr:hypothetical protein G7046_g889 [Stylonectria norvegica]
MIVLSRQQPLASEFTFRSHAITLPTLPTARAIKQLPRRQATMPLPSLIERLPQELRRLVFSNLDYQSLIYLSTLNRHLHQSIVPQDIADPADKFEFVIRAAKDFPQHRPSEKGQDHNPGNFECYVCFRVRAPEHFDVLQPQSAYFDTQGRVVTDREPGQGDRMCMLRRFCIECGVKEGLHAPFDCLGEAGLLEMSGLRRRLPAPAKAEMVTRKKMPSLSLSLSGVEDGGVSGGLISLPAVVHEKLWD